MPPTALGLRTRIAAALGLGAVLAWSFHDPAGRFTWWLEASPVLVGLPLFLLLDRRFHYTPLAHGLVGVGAVMMLVGAHYTFAEVPLGDRLQEWLGLRRNPYDRLGHVFQGVMPAMLLREMLLGATPLRRGALLFTLVAATTLALAALYELAECWVALATGDSAEDFLGMQGDEWDSQWDMSCALVGALAAQALLGPWQDRQLRRRSAGPAA